MTNLQHYFLVFFPSVLLDSQVPTRSSNLLFNIFPLCKMSVSLLAWIVMKNLGGLIKRRYQLDTWQILTFKTLKHKFSHWNRPNGDHQKEKGFFVGNSLPFSQRQIDLHVKCLGRHRSKTCSTTLGITTAFCQNEDLFS